ncbi:MAG TPA: peptide ABC transporter substrate-binding protein [Phycisphaerales bacterium]|nr:peptide ABC transporter substrate-binding protein [Phycisphaerales bacterium]
MLRLLVPILAVLALVLAFTALDRPLPKADFTFINRGDVSTLDPAIISWQQDNRVARIVSEGLTRSDNFAHNFEPTPATAASWDFSADKRTITFHIRKDAAWSNGEPLTAHDFVFSWRRSMMPDLAGDYMKLYEFIEGGKQFIAWRAAALKDFQTRTDFPTDAARADAAQILWQETLARFDELVQCKAIDDHTLRVTLVRPTPYFLDLTAFPPMYPVYPPLVRAHESIDPTTGMLRSRPEWTKPPINVTNGPFVLTAWRFKRDMRFEKNPHYWNKDAIAIDSIAIPSIQDPSTTVLAFNTGAVDWLSDVVPGYRDRILAEKHAFYNEHKDAVAALRAQFPRDPIEVDRRLPKDPRNNLGVFPAFGTYFYNFNCSPTLTDGRPNPLADARVRRALTMAIGRETVADDIRRIGEPAATTLIPRNSIAGYASPAGLPHNPDKARALLAEAGYPRGEGLMPIGILFNTEGEHALIAQSVAKDWERELGVRTRLEQVEIKVFRERLKNADYMVSRAGWFGDYGDPTTFLNINKTGDGNNDRKFSHAPYDTLLDQAEEQPDRAARMQLLAEAERMLLEEQAPLAPIFQYVQIIMFDPHRITGLSSHPRMEQQLFRIDIFGDGKGTDQPQLMYDGVGEGSFGAVNAGPKK